MAAKIFRESFFFLILAFFCLFMMNFSFSEAQMVPAVYVFGDSLVDVGNNNHLHVSIAKANFPHNGVDFPTKKPTGRFSNGKNAADFLAEKLGLPTSPPYLSLKDNKNRASVFKNGVSFASGGAGILNGTDQARHQAIPMTKQVDYYAIVYQDLVRQLGSSGAQQHLSKSLFAVVIGSNDMFDYLGSSDLRKEHTPQQFFSLMTTTLKEQLKRLYGNGARKFVINGLGVIGCIPSERVKKQTEECNEEANSWCRNYNVGLKSMLKELKSELNGLSYSYFDTYSVMHNIIQNPSAYGFTEVKEACCGLGKLKAKIPCVPFSTYCSNRSDHVFWDLYHPSQATARIFVDSIFDGSSQYTFPINRLYKFGARKFVVVGLGQIGRTLLQRVENQAEECNEEVNNWCVKYNGRLKTMLQELKSEFQDLSYSYFEAHNFMQNVIQKNQNPLNYGFTEIKEACCGRHWEAEGKDSMCALFNLLQQQKRTSLQGF